MAETLKDRLVREIVLTGIEHHAVLDVVDWLAAHEGAEPVLVPVDDDGRVDLAAWGAALAAAPERTALATLMWANNEIGTVQPVAVIQRSMDLADQDLGRGGCNRAGCTFWPHARRWARPPWPKISPSTLRCALSAQWRSSVSR